MNGIQSRGITLSGNITSVFSSYRTDLVLSDPNNSMFLSFATGRAIRSVEIVEAFQCLCRLGFIQEYTVYLFVVKQQQTSFIPIQNPKIQGASCKRTND